jgi:hypothetical protein
VKPDNGGIDMPIIVTEHVDSMPVSKSNRLRVIAVLLGMAVAGALFASFLLPAASIEPVSEMSPLAR